MYIDKYIYICTYAASGTSSRLVNVFGSPGWCISGTRVQTQGQQVADRTIAFGNSLWLNQFATFRNHFPPFSPVSVPVTPRVIRTSNAFELLAARACEGASPESHPGRSPGFGAKQWQAHRRSTCPYSWRGPPGQPSAMVTNGIAGQWLTIDTIINHWI